VAGQLPSALGEQLLASARAAFDSGVALTAGIGVALMVAAAVLAVVSLRTVRG
jgi:DHA2 family multidrug resistance protein-like MFS transporter